MKGVRGKVKPGQVEKRGVIRGNKRRKLKGGLCRVAERGNGKDSLRGKTEREESDDSNDYVGKVRGIKYVPKRG